SRPLPWRPYGRGWRSSSAAGCSPGNRMNLLTDSDPRSTLAPVPPGAEPVIVIEDVSVRYRIPRERVVSIKDYAIRRVKGKLVHDEFWALKGVSLVVRRGETEGLMGVRGGDRRTVEQQVG